MSMLLTSTNANSAVITLEQLNRESAQRRKSASLDNLNLILISVVGMVGLIATFAS